jgi:release factor glutamine methyltransferase
MPPAAAADVWTVRRVLEWTTQHLKKHGSDTPRLDAEILLAHARGCPRIALYTQFDEPLSDPVRTRMRELVQRRAQAEPVAYLVGHREFFSLDFDVTRDVLIPRPDTETLVLAVLDAIKSSSSPRPHLGGEGQGEGGSAPNDSNAVSSPRILDLCTGSGCVAIAVAKNCPAARVTATDVSAAAIHVATENAAKLQVADRVRLAAGDLFAAVGPDDRFDIIAANPPYVTTSELESLAQDIRKYEPRSALDGGPDGLDVIRRIIREAPDRLVPGGQIFIEISPEQGAAVEAFYQEVGRYADVRLLKDLAGRLRVAAARLAAT